MVGKKLENERRKTTDQRVSVIFEPGVEISEIDQVKGRFRSGRRGRRFHAITAERAGFFCGLGEVISAVEGADLWSSR